MEVSAKMFFLGSGAFFARAWEKYMIARCHAYGAVHGTVWHGSEYVFVCIFVKHCQR